MKKQLCDQCENRCPVDALKCGRGRRRFESEFNVKNENMDHKMSQGIIGQLRQCGHILHHGGVSGDDLLSALNPQEQSELERLLNILIADWNTRADKGTFELHGGFHHGKRE